jgi:O-succinylhomoserine sulfhydrylase
MAAISAALMCCLKTGDHVLCARSVFGAIRYVIEEVLSRFGISSSVVDGRDLDAWRAGVRPNTKLFFFETPSNPTLEIVDIAGVSEIAHKAGARVIVDNAFASPALQRPMDFGADIVVHSSTKYIDGQGRAMGGIILCKEDFLKDHLQIYLRNTGPAISPFNAWVHLKSLETLDLRMRAHSANAAQVVDFLAREKNVRKVLYPFREQGRAANDPQLVLARRQMSAGGGIVTFEVAGGKKEAFKVAKALKLVDISNNLGDAKSLLTHPATTTHQRLSPEARQAMDVTDGMLRIAVGLEDPADICEDLAQALKVI